jgi:dTDP-4-amino-4,6-dideoxygalactose transaminase
MNVPFLDLRLAYKELESEINEVVLRSMDSGWYIGGDSVETFERHFASYVGSKYCVSVGNGLDAIHLSLQALGIGPRDEVLVPSHTFIATWLAVAHAGATPIPVDIDDSTYNIDPNKIANAITSRTRAIIPVHLYGQPSDLNSIHQIAKEHNLRIVEDAAQAHGATFYGKQIGGHGNTVAWSFYPGKNLGALGDGGAITTDDYELCIKLKMLRNYGARQKYKHEILGFNSRLDPLQAEILSTKLLRLNEWNERRRVIAKTYLDELNHESFGLPFVNNNCTSSWHLFVIRLQKRDLVQQLLSEKGIHTLIHYPLLPQNQCNFEAKGHLPSKVAEKVVQEILSLPISPHHSESQIEYVIKTLNSLAKTHDLRRPDSQKVPTI